MRDEWRVEMAKEFNRRILEAVALGNLEFDDQHLLGWRRLFSFQE